MLFCFRYKPVSHIHMCMVRGVVVVVVVVVVNSGIESASSRYGSFRLIISRRYDVCFLTFLVFAANVAFRREVPMYNFLFRPLLLSFMHIGCVVSIVALRVAVNLRSLLFRLREGNFS